MCNKSHNLVLLSRTLPFSVSHSFTRQDSTPHLSRSLWFALSSCLSPPPTHDPIFAFLKLSLIRFFVNLLSFCFFEYHLLNSFLLMLSRPILFKWTIPGLSFFIFVYSTVNRKTCYVLHFYDDWLWTVVLWYRKWPLCQLGHHHIFFSIFFLSQCGKIWWNFANLAKSLKPWAILVGII